VRAGRNGRAVAASGVDREIARKSEGIIGSWSAGRAQPIDAHKML